MLIIDDYSRIKWVTFFREKSEAFERFKVFQSMLEDWFDNRIKCLRFR